jgi:hypothetical protein
MTVVYKRCSRFATNPQHLVHIPLNTQPHLTTILNPKSTSSYHRTLHASQTDDTLFSQMSTARGFIRSTSSTKFTATFLIDDIQYTLTGSIANAVQTFASTNATLNYTSTEQLTALRQFNGKVGIQDVTFTFTNGPKISGPLDMPIDPASNVSGSGTWNGA